MFNGHKISKLLEERHLKKKSLIEYMQTYPSGLDAIIKDGNPRADTLEKIADFFDCLLIISLTVTLKYLI